MKRKKQVGRGRPPRGASRKRLAVPPPYPVALKQKAVRLHLEEGIPINLIGQELNVCPDSVVAWVKRYQKQGEAGLQKQPRGAAARSTTLHPAVHEAIADIKEKHPTFGAGRVAQWLRRVLFLPGSREAVRQSFKRQGLAPGKPRPKPRRNPPKPRFFERTSPNQMWQSDIFTFQLNGHNAYLLGFIDDYSRYITGLGVYRGQTAENLLEIYRRAVSEHGRPKEMLTDNGRQYVAWHGKTRFQVALARDRVAHIRSAPHHPQTLGKIERFWKTIWEEFLERARFETFEEAVERIGYWVQHYNHRRPHQGIEGLCPADRYFSLQGEMKKTIEKNIATNVEEMALRGKPKTPFYLVGRVGGQNVVLQEERGQVRITVDGKEAGHGRDGGEEGAAEPQREGEEPGGAGAVDGSAAAGGDLPGAGHPGQPAGGLAGAGDGGYAPGAGAAHAAAGGTGADADAADGAAAGSEAGAPGDAAGPAGAGQAAPGAREAGGVGAAASPGRDGDEARAGGVAAGDPAGAGRNAERGGGGADPGRLAQDLLPMGGAGLAGHVGITHGAAAGKAAEGGGHGGDAPEGAAGAVGAGADAARAADPRPAAAG